MKAILFDLYETLISNLDPDFVRGQPTVAERLGIETSVYDAVWPEISVKWESGFIATYEDALTTLCRGAGTSSNKTEIAEIVQKMRIKKSKIFRAVLPEVIEMLESLKQLDLKLGVVTNAHDEDTRPWVDCSLLKYFDVFVASHEVGLRKPDAAIYELACDQLGIKASDAYFVGDGGNGELAGAEAVGLRPIWCTWYLDKWPDGITPNPFKGGEWRERPRDKAVQYNRMDKPMGLVDLLASS